MNSKESADSASPDRSWPLERLKRDLAVELQRVEQLRHEFPRVQRQLDAAASMLAPLFTHPPSAPIPFSTAQALSSYSRHPDVRQLEAIAATTRKIMDGAYQLRLDSQLLKAWHSATSGLNAAAAGQWKSGDNFVRRLRPGFDNLTTVKAGDAPQCVEQIDARLDAAWREDPSTRMLQISAYLFDFFRIHPFADGNGRVARLAWLALLLKAGHDVMRCVSLEFLLGRKRQDYYIALTQSDEGWRLGAHDLTPWARFTLTILIDGYELTSRRAVQLQSLADGASAVLAAIRALPSGFAHEHIRAAAPQTPNTVLDLVLHRLELAGTLRSRQAAQGKRWRQA